MTDPTVVADILEALRTHGKGGTRVGRVTAARAADLIEELSEARLCDCGDALSGLLGAKCANCQAAAQ